MTQWVTGYLPVYKAKDWIIFENKNIVFIAYIVQPNLIMYVVIASFWFLIIIVEHYERILKLKLLQRLYVIPNIEAMIKYCYFVSPLLVF